MNDEKNESDIYNCTPHVGGYLHKKHLIHRNPLGVYKDMLHHKYSISFSKTAFLTAKEKKR